MGRLGKRAATTADVWAAPPTDNTKFSCELFRLQSFKSLFVLFAAQRKSLNFVAGTIPTRIFLRGQVVTDDTTILNLCV